MQRNWRKNDTSNLVTTIRVSISRWNHAVKIGNINKSKILEIFDIISDRWKRWKTDL